MSDFVQEPAEEYEYDDGSCPQCGDGDWEDGMMESGCIDDLCHGGAVPCMHGDWTTLPCSLCGKRP